VIEFRLLGEIEARIDGVALDLGHARQRCVLVALLLDANRVVHADQLLDRVWGENRARESLYSYLSRLRQALPDVPITRRSGGYVLCVDPDQVDVHRFRRLAGQARVAGDVRLFDEALSLWRGEAFAGLDTPWLATVRESLHRERLAAELDRNDLAPDAARIPELTERAAEFPLDERLAGQLMLAFQRAGRLSNAFAVYDETRRALAGQLGIEPSPQLRQLRQQILTSNGTAKARFDLPRDVSEFTGRISEQRHLLRSREGIAAIDGMAGIGKTALAVHVAHQLAPQFPDGQLFLDLHAYTPGNAPLTPGTALDKLLRTAGVLSTPEDLDERAALWRARLAGRRMLIVLDNALDTAQVAPLLPGTPDCLVVVTSRHRLAGLDGARVLSLDVFTPAEAGELFGRIAGPERAQSPYVDEVLRLCGHLPLAIRLAAARLQHRPTWTVEHLAGRLRDQRLLAELRVEDRGVAAAFSLSYQQLDAAHQSMFRLLGLVPGTDLDVYAAAALSDLPTAEADDLLEGLLDAHLVQQLSAGRYAMHSLLRAYASQLPDPGQDAAVARLLAYYLGASSTAMDLLAPHEPHRRTPVAPAGTPVPSLTSYDEALLWLETEWPNLLAAARAQYPDYTMRLSAVLWRFLYIRGHHEEAHKLHTGALDAARTTGERVLEGQAIYHLGMCFERLGRYPAAIRLVSEAIDVFRDTGSRLLEGHAIHSLGMLHSWYQDRRDAAVAYYEQAVTIGQETGTGVLEGLALNNLGMVYAELGEHEHAIELYRRALTRSEQAGARYLVAPVLDSIGSSLTQLGRLGEAQDHLERALALARSSSTRDFEAEILVSLGEAKLSGGDPADALVHLEQALRISQDTGMRISQARAHDAIGRTQAELGDKAAACEHWERALALYTELGVAEADDMRQQLANIEPPS
jgi:DNA-binding SARP family transcriptional activator/tetratricopeptide (TPR) repeat protein